MPLRVIKERRREWHFRRTVIGAEETVERPPITCAGPVTLISTSSAAVLPLVVTM